MTSNYIIDVTEADFQYEVLAFSSQMPVVVDFWAEWCNPCRILGPILERLAIQGDGRFRLAKLNVDENPILIKQYQVKSIPSIKGFIDGVIQAELTGLQPENVLTDFIRKLSPTPGDLNLEKGKSLLLMGGWSKAEEAFEQVLEAYPDHPEGLLGMARCLLAQGKAQNANLILRSFPASKEFMIAEKLKPLARALMDAGAPDEMVDLDDMLTPAYLRSLDLVRKGNMEAALDGLFHILRQDKNFLKGDAKLISLAILEILGDENEITRQYRSELASILF
ncbi:MAG: tetratricopeptide repeat protein [Anaerolineales bacterium]|nr:tetratricopeptide repeat protein [Anaerolineales bacterium]